jgi:hypothetical protein
MTEWVFDGKANWKFDAIRKLQDKEALALLFDPSYQGDMVLPLVVGLETLLFKAYGASNEFDIPKDGNAALLIQASYDIEAFKQQLLNQTGHRDALQFATILENTKSLNLIQETFNQMLQRIKKNNNHHFMAPIKIQTPS